MNNVIQSVNPWLRLLLYITW